MSSRNKILEYTNIQVLSKVLAVMCTLNRVLAHCLYVHVYVDCCRQHLQVTKVSDKGVFQRVEDAVSDLLYICFNTLTLLQQREHHAVESWVPPLQTENEKRFLTRFFN